MTKSKKILAGVLTAVIAVGAVSGIVLGVRAANRQPVMVVSAGELNYGGGWYSSEMQGMITSDVSQDVYLTDTQTVSEVMVKEGDTVQEGDVLLTYDTAMTSLNLEREKLNRQQIDLKVQVAQENLKKLRNTKPVSDNGGTGGWTDDPGILFPENPGEGGFPGVPEEPEPTEEPTPTPTPTEAPVSEYRVRFHSNGHGTVPEDVLLEKGQSFQDYLNGLKEEEKQAYLLTEEGYVFGGWYKDQICTVPFDPEETLTEDTELYAGWSLAVPDYSQVEALGTLTAEAEAYNAPEAEHGAMLGTAVNPYRYLCKDGAVIQADFMNALMMKATEAAAQNPEAHYYFVLEVHEGDKVGGKLLKAWMQDAAQISAEYPPDWQGKLNLATGNVDVSRVSAAASEAAAVSDGILSTYPVQPSQKISAAQKVKSKFYVNNPNASGKKEFIALCVQIAEENPQDTILRDSSTFALSALRDYSAVEAIVNSPVLDRISKVAAVNENFMTLWDVLKESPSEQDIAFVITCMEIHPIKDLADDLERALETVKDRAVQSRGHAVVEKMRGPEGIEANDKWVS